MVRLMIIASCIFTMSVNAQQEDYIRPGLLNSSLTISPSWMLNKPEVNYYLTGFIEGYLDKHISLRGETHYFMDGKQDEPFFAFNSRTFFGLQYHLNKNNIDGHIGFMPGVSVLQVTNNPNAEGKNPIHVVPSMSVNIGVTFYIWKFCNFFADATYINSTIPGLRGNDGRTDEFLISAGLGFNLNTVRIKK